MKFEYVLQIYWSKGLLINTYLQSHQTNFNHMFYPMGGFSWATKRTLINRFEMHTFKRRPNQPIDTFGSYIPMSLNILFSQITSVNSMTIDLTRLNLYRLYLTRTTRGRSHALGKPSRGQRTWSNAWTAYRNNSETRAFISKHQKIKNETLREEKINYKLIKKKSAIRKKKVGVIVIRKRINSWF